LDLTGKRCPDDSCVVAGREWEITFGLYRSPGMMRTPPKLTAPKDKVVITKLNEPSDPVRGYFTLQHNETPLKIWGYDGWTEEMPYDI